MIWLISILTYFSTGFGVLLVLKICGAYLDEEGDLDSLPLLWLIIWPLILVALLLQKMWAVFVSVNRWMSKTLQRFKEVNSRPEDSCDETPRQNDALTNDTLATEVGGTVDCYKQKPTAEVQLGWHPGCEPPPSSGRYYIRYMMCGTEMSCVAYYAQENGGWMFHEGGRVIRTFRQPDCWMDAKISPLVGKEIL